MLEYFNTSKDLDMQIHIENLHIDVQQPRNLMMEAILKAMTQPPAGVAANFKSLPRLGQAWDEERGIFLGVMPGTKDERDYALILPFSKDADLGERAWGERGKDIAGATSITDGFANTAAMAAAGNALAQEVQGMEVDGKTGLFIPARHEARMCALFAADQFDKSKWHWTSTQYSADYAWVQDFDDGFQGVDVKDDKYVVRLLRRSFL